MNRNIIRIYDASDKVVKNMLGSWSSDFLKLIAVEEMPSSPHLYRIYETQPPEDSDPTYKLTLIVRDKHLAQQDFNSLDTAQDLLQKFTLRGDVAKKQQQNG